jgi:phage baseplate assembly protein W
MAGSSSGGGSSSAAALQSLAAARNARSSPHTAGLSAGSILQSALSGSRTNPNFAPTLAQLLTNPANEQQQQQQQHSQQTALGNNQPSVSIPVATASSSSSSAAVAAAAAAAAAASAASSAEVLTLSNLLATARVLEISSFGSHSYVSYYRSYWLQGHVTITSERAELANDDVTVVVTFQT